MPQVAEPKVKIDEDVQKLLSLAIQVADEAVKWTEKLQSEKENGDIRATYELLQAEAALMSLAMMYKSHLDVYHGLAEETDDKQAF